MKVIFEGKKYKRSQTFLVFLLERLSIVTDSYFKTTVNVLVLILFLSDVALGLGNIILSNCARLLEHRQPKL